MSEQKRLEELEDKVEYLEHQVFVLLVLQVAFTLEGRKTFREVDDNCFDALDSENPPTRYHDNFSKRNLDTVFDAMVGQVRRIFGEKHL